MNRPIEVATAYCFPFIAPCFGHLSAFFHACFGLVCRPRGQLGSVITYKTDSSNLLLKAANWPKFEPDPPGVEMGPGRNYVASLDVLILRFGSLVCDSLDLSHTTPVARRDSGGLNPRS
jgi:hypothetical protein